MREEMLTMPLQLRLTDNLSVTVARPWRSSAPIYIDESEGIKGTDGPQAYGPDGTQTPSDNDGVVGCEHDNIGQV